MSPYLCGRNDRKEMKPPFEDHISQEAYDAICQERDKWAEIAMAEHQRIVQLEEEIRGLKNELGEKVNRPVLFCRITRAAYAQNKAQTVDDELRSARTSAPRLISAIRTNEALGYLDTVNLNSKELYEMLNEHYGLPFGVRAFQLARSQ